MSLTWPPHVHKADMCRCTGAHAQLDRLDVIFTNIRVACTTEVALPFYLEVIARHAAVRCTIWHSQPGTIGSLRQQIRTLARAACCAAAWAGALLPAAARAFAKRASATARFACEHAALGVDVSIRPGSNAEQQRK